ncbi:MAG: hypothetical protein R3E68_22655 [Burkholderiaceae bacterium]
MKRFIVHFGQDCSVFFERGAAPGDGHVGPAPALRFHRADCPID